MTAPQRHVITRVMPKKKTVGDQPHLTGRSYNKVPTKWQIVREVLELQHAAILILAGHADLDVHDLNNDVRSLLTQLRGKG